MKKNITNTYKEYNDLMSNHTGWGWRRFDEESPRWRNNVLIVGKDKIIRTLCIDSYDIGDPLPGIEKENMIYWHVAPQLPKDLI